MIFLPLNNGEEFPIEEDAKRELFNLLLEKTKKLEHQMTFAEAANDPKMVHPNQYAFYFESFDVAAKMAWGELQEQENEDAPRDGDDEIATPADIIKKRAIEIKKEKERQRELAKRKKEIVLRPLYEERMKNRSRFEDSTQQKLKKKIGDEKKSPKTPHKGGRPSNTTREEMIAKLVDFYKNNGRMPHVKECGTPEIPSYQVLYNYLGEREKWLQIVRRITEGSKTKQIVKEYYFKDNAPIDIHFETEKFTFFITSSVDKKDVKLWFTEK